MSKLDEILSQANALPALPDMQIRLTQLTGDPDCSINDMVPIIQLDPGLTANLLRLANSAQFGGNREITSVRDAVIRLGTNRILGLAFSDTSLRFFHNALEGYGLKPERLWLHSTACAFAAEAVAKRIDHGDQAPAAFSAGLLCNVGKVILSPLVLEKRDEIRRHVESGASFIEAERRVFGFDHAEAGGRLAELWQFPPALVLAIQYHKTPGECPDGTILPRIVHVAEIIAISLGFGLGDIDGMQYRVEEDVVSRLGLSTRDMEWCSSEVVESIRRSREIMHLPADG